MSPVPTNHVSGSSVAGIEVTGNRARIVINVIGLLNGSPHAMHIAVDGSGHCPPAGAARNLHGHRAIGLTETLPYVGLPGAALTVRGSTSPVHALALNRYPRSGTFHYDRTIPLTANLRRNLDNGHAVILILGIDYDHNGRYTGVLGYERLAPSLPVEASAPALCGVLH